MIASAWYTIKELLLNTNPEAQMTVLVFGTVLIILLFLLLSLLINRWLKKWMARVAVGLQPDGDPDRWNAALKPVRWLVIWIGIYIALRYLPLTPAMDEWINRLFRSLAVILVTWGIYSLLDSHSLLSDEIREKYRLDSSLVVFFSKLARFLIVVLGGMMAANQWGYDFNGFLAGLGLGGLAIALAAKDALANIVGGIVIILEKPFTIGDLITTPNVEGVVEDISFRSTRLKTSTQAIITVPNSMLAGSPITNHTRMGKKRLSFRLSLHRETTPDQVQQCVSQIQNMLLEHPDILHDHIQVFFEQIGESSLDVSVSCSSATSEGVDHQVVRADINIRILGILDALGIRLALPSQMIYVEKSEQTS